MMLMAMALAVTSAGVPNADASIAFPGQWAPARADARYPASPKGCARFTDPTERVACLEFVIADWGRTARYEAANAALAPAKKGERRVVFFGDSITDNWSKPTAGGFFPGKPYVNRGIGGQTTPQMLARFRNDVIALGPRAVVILAGTNDLAGNGGLRTPEAIEGNLASMAELAHAHGIRVVLASLLPICDCKTGKDGATTKRTGERPPEAIIAINRWMADFARKNRFVFVDYYAALSDGSGMLTATLTDDGLHPNAAGYALMAPLAEKAIAAALK